MKLFTFLISLLVLTTMCRPQKHIVSGFLIQKIRELDSTTNEYTKPVLINDTKVWYYDNMSIMEITSVRIVDSFGITSIKRPFQYYLFIDRNTKSFYHYTSLSDTARILYSYAQDDTVELRKAGGWRYYLKGYINFTDLTYLDDTSINGISYKRIKYLEHFRNQSWPVIGYLRCDKKDTQFSYDEAVTKPIGCPMIKYEQLRSESNPFPSSAEIIFIRDRLTKQEESVFKAWKQNLKKFPVLN